MLGNESLLSIAICDGTPNNNASMRVVLYNPPPSLEVRVAESRPLHEIGKWGAKVLWDWGGSVLLSVSPKPGLEASASGIGLVFARFLEGMDKWGRKRYHKWGVQNRFSGAGFRVCFPSLEFPSPLFAAL